MPVKIQIPKDFPVQPLQPGDVAKDRVTCGTCGLSWDDAIGTTWTPAPSGRCPFEYFHLPEKPEPKVDVNRDQRKIREMTSLLLTCSGQMKLLYRDKSPEIIATVNETLDRIEAVLES